MGRETKGTRNTGQTNGCILKNAPDNINSKVNRNVDAQSSSSHQLSAEVALVQIATHTLEKMANSLEGKRNINIPMEDRAAFAKALKGAMDALAKQS